MKTPKKTKAKKTTTAKVKTKKKPIVQKESTRIISLLDRSGSMYHMAQDAIGGYNSFISEQKNLKDEATLSAVLFNDQYQPMYQGKVLKVQDVPELTDKDFISQGATALYDTIGKSIHAYKAEKKTTDEKVLMVIITDGHDTASREYSQKDIADLISFQKKQNWQFIFLCSTEDAVTIGTTLNIARGNTFKFENTSLGNKKMYKKVGMAAALYRGMSMADVSTSFDSVGVLKSEKLLEEE